MEIFKRKIYFKKGTKIGLEVVKREEILVKAFGRHTALPTPGF